MEAFIEHFWPHILAAINAALVIGGTCHALLWKRDSRAVIGWVGLIWLAPILGSIAYFTLGINRIRRKASTLGFDFDHDEDGIDAVDDDSERIIDRAQGHAGFTGLVELVGRLTQRPLLDGNRIETLVDGDEAYPAMLEAIERAQRSVALVTYIFDSDRVGRMFVDALRSAHERGIQVRVLVDDVGARYSRPRITRLLTEAGVPHASFLPARAPWALEYANLRNHRKILVTDGTVGFTGGTNIREGHWLGLDPKEPVQCLHFRLAGPVVGQLFEVFSHDWAFTTGETLGGPAWTISTEHRGRIHARGIAAGPDDDLEKMQDTILGALSAARYRIDIVTPYFVPNVSLIDALGVAAMRGVDVRIVVPSRNNLPVVQWASTAQLWQVLRKRCRVWESAEPFDHSKLLVVDHVWTLLGSGNWDQRSLRLNFELNVECYDRDLAAMLTRHVDASIATAREITLAEVDSRSLPIRLRDGLARLLTPYL